MQDCGYAARRRTDIGYVALWFPVVGVLLWVVLTSYAARHGYFFHGGFVDIIG